MDKKRGNLRERHESGGVDRRRYEAPRLGRIHWAAHGAAGGTAQKRPGTAGALPGQKGGAARPGWRPGKPTPGEAHATGTAPSPTPGAGGDHRPAALESHAGCGSGRPAGYGRAGRPRTWEGYDFLHEPHKPHAITYVNRGAGQLCRGHRRRRHRQGHGVRPRRTQDRLVIYPGHIEGVQE